MINLLDYRHQIIIGIILLLIFSAFLPSLNIASANYNQYKRIEFIQSFSEPILNEDEQDTLGELSHLFKMLADVNITDMNKEEKEKYLGETLEQIIIDNNIKFGLEKKNKSNKSEKGLGLFKVREKIHVNVHSDPNRKLIIIFQVDDRSQLGSVHHVINTGETRFSAI